MKNRDQQLLEEAYTKVLKEGRPDDPRQNVADYSNRRVADYSEPKDYLQDFKNRERNAGVEEPKQYSDPARPAAKPYMVKRKWGAADWFIKIPEGDPSGIEPGTYGLNKTMQTSNKQFKIVWNKEKQQAEKVDLGEVSMPPVTQWGVKDVPGGDID